MYNSKEFPKKLQNLNFLKEYLRKEDRYNLKIIL